jgi:hypothetical protein
LKILPSSNFQAITKQEKWNNFLETCQEVLTRWLLRFNTVIGEMNRSFAPVVCAPCPKIEVKPFMKMLITQKFSDVVLMSKDGATINAHKIIMSSIYSIFYSFASNNN